MTNFLMVADPDPDRRTQFRRIAKPRLAMLEGLVLGECRAGDFVAMWASGPRAPVSTWSDGSGAAVVWGRALADDDGRLVQATELPAIWSDAARAMPPAFDGYHVAVSYDSHRGMTVGADILGMYPVFWWSDGTVHLVGSSPELFRHHPRFRWNLDLVGMVGILLAGHSLRGRTLMDSVRRLDAGNLLLASPASPPREIRQYELPVSADYFDLPYSRTINLLHDSLEAAVARHVPTETESALALSGGRDSRLLAAMMVKLRRIPRAVTFGADGDIDMRCARAVASVLSLQHQWHDVPFDKSDVQAKLHTTWLHCSTGLNSISYWNCHEYLGSLPPALATGYVMGAVVGGSYMDWPCGEPAAPLSFENFFARINAVGIAADTLQLLLRRDVFGDRLQDVLQNLKNDYQAYSPLESQRAWCFGLHHRQRFVIGNPPWSISFGAWPIMPAVDKKLLKVAAGLPAGVLAERRAQEEIIRARYPALAELPLAGLGYDTTPLSPRVRYVIRNGLLARIQPWIKWWQRPQELRQERRYYFRIYDFNSPAWKTARRQAEPTRGKLDALFNRDVLDRLLPPPEVDVAMADGVLEASGKKALVGLSLWADQYL